MTEFFYTALINEDGRIEFAEHYADKKVRDDRAKTLELEAAIRGEADGKWLSWVGDEPYEVIKAREEYIRLHPITTDTPMEERQKILDETIDYGAKASTISVLTEPPVDDRPEWYKAGFQSQAEYDKAKKVVDFAKKKMNKEDEDA